MQRLPALHVAAIAFPMAAALPAFDEKHPPVRMGAVVEAQAVVGGSIPGAARLAAEKLDGQGGIDGRKIEIAAADDHSSTVEAVHGFRRAERPVFLAFLKTGAGN